MTWFAMCVRQKLCRRRLVHAFFFFVYLGSVMKFNSRCELVFFLSPHQTGNAIKVLMQSVCEGLMLREQCAVVWVRFVGAGFLALFCSQREKLFKISNSKNAYLIAYTQVGVWSIVLAKISVFGTVYMSASPSLRLLFFCAKRILSGLFNF